MRAQGPRLRADRPHPGRAHGEDGARSTARATRPCPACSSAASPSTARARSSSASRRWWPSRRCIPEPIADAVREAERWGDEELQDLGRRLPWGALHFRPEALGSFGGAGRSTRPAPTSRSGWAGELEVPRHHRPAARRRPRRAARQARPRRRARRGGHDRRRGAERRRPADRRHAARAALRRRRAAADRGPRGRARRPRVVPGLRGRHPGRGVPGRVGARALSRSAAELLLVAARDDRGPLDRLAGLDRPRQPHELRVRPRQRRRRARALAGVSPGGRPSQTCSGSIMPSLAAPAIAFSRALASLPAISSYSPRSPASSGHARPNVWRFGLSKNRSQSPPSACSP